MNIASILRLSEPRTSALDFAPEILAIQSRPPSPLPRLVLYLLLVLFAILIVWSILAKLDIVATADGKLVPQTYLKIIQPADSGVIKEILANEGDQVKAGQVLMRLDTTLSQADRTIADKEVTLRRLQLRRIDAELRDVAMRRVASDSGGMFAEVDAQARARRQVYRDSLSTEEAGLAQSQADLAAGQQQLTKLEKVLPSHREEEAALAKLAEQKLVPRLQLIQKERERIQAEQDLLSQIGAIESLRARIAQSETRIAHLASDYRQQLLSERVDAQAALDKGEQELAKQSHRAELSELRAPQDGIIKDIATSTVGAVVNAGTVLASLVPIGETLRAEVMVKNEDVGFTHVGQPVKIKLASYPFQKYGMLQGTVEHLAADATDAQKSQNNANAEDDSRTTKTATYKAVVKLDRQQLMQGASPLTISAGMQVVAEIKQGERTVMEYLLSPVQKVMGEAGRER